MTPDGFLHIPGTTGRTVVLLPGFATDHRVFEGLFPGDGRLVPRRVGPAAAAERLAAHLARTGSGPVPVVAWSLGAFVAAELVARRPELVERLVLVGARKRFDPDELAAFRRSLCGNRERCLSDFYARCFLPAQRAAYRRFRASLLPAYLREMDTARLLEELDYLGASEIRPERLPAGRSVFVHGAHDVVAPVGEARDLAARAPGGAIRVLADAAHAAFFSDGFPAAAERR